MERWLPVPGYERYEVSDLGRVRSLIPWNGHPVPRLLRPTRCSPLPYRKVRLVSDDGGYPTLLVHRLVMEAFVGPCPSGMEVRHLDGDHANNRLDNLEYGTRPENQHDAVQHGTHHNAGKTHCPQGHPYAGDNVYIDGHARKCRTCRRERARTRYRAKARA